MQNAIMRNVEESTKEGFYPTPNEIAEKMASFVDWYKVGSVLEPSAGKGDLAEVVSKKMNGLYHRYDDKERRYKTNLDCIEYDPYLRSILKEKGFRVVYDDFLTFETQKRYDLCFMNPPFNQGAKHLLKAIDIMSNGGQIVCLLNAETVRNPFTRQRQELMQLLNKYEAKIQYIKNAFSDAFRKTDVEIAMIYFAIPNVQKESFIFDGMKEAPTYKPSPINREDFCGDIVRFNVIDKLVSEYDFEVACGVRLIEEYRALKETAASPLIEMRVSGEKDYSCNPLSINQYIEKTRLKHWEKLFDQKQVTSHLTSGLLSSLRKDIEKFKRYDFSAYNILTFLQELSTKMMDGIEETIIKLFDDWTARGWSEDSPNRHYYNGWKTNDSFAVGQKVIIPMYAFTDWNGNRFQAYKVDQQFYDIEKVFDFLDNGLTNDLDFNISFKIAEETQQTKNLDTKYFTVTFYKKGTAHLVFKDKKLLEKFNIFAARNKNWLPPVYGKKKYSQMTKEEKDVIDSFQGKEKYEEVMKHADYYLAENSTQIPLLAN